MVGSPKYLLTIEFEPSAPTKNVYFILSLPNPWAAFFRVLRFGHYRPDQPVKFYGLPVEPPEDRHRWFFSSEEAENFVLYRARMNNMKVLQMDTETVDDIERGLKRLIRTFARSFLFRRDLNLRDLYAGSLWAVLEKKSS